MADGNAISLVLILCAVIIFLVVMLLLRLTRVNWMLSILGGTLAVVIYMTLNFAIHSLLSAFLRGWLWA